MVAEPDISPETVTQPIRLDRRAAEILRATDRRLRAITSTLPHDRFQVIHVAATELVPVDALMIGLFSEDRLVVPFAVERGHLEAPDLLHVRRGTVAGHVRETARSYRHADDDGAMLATSVPFGEGSEPSRDAVVAPVRDPEGSVRGILGVHSLTPEVYGPREVRAIEALATLLGRAEHPSATRPEDEELVRAFPELALQAADGIERLHEAATLIAQVRSGLEETASALEAQDEADGDGAHAESGHHRDHLRALAGLCEEASTTIAALATKELGVADRPAGARPPTPELTRREREIARLIVIEGMTNTEIADRLFISVKSVKTHVGSILRKCGQTQRSGIALVVPPAELFRRDDGSRPGHRRS